jgi:class 3 adenylate cyclase/HAMP domain-containing protein
MRYSIRTKISASFIFMNVIISIGLGLSLYITMLNLFVMEFQSHKLSLARMISYSIKGNSHKKINNPKSISASYYKKYFQLINKIFKSEPNIKYIYTLNYEPTTKLLTYAIDGKLSENDTIWVESNVFSFSFYYNENDLIIENGINKDHLDFSLNIDNKPVNVKVLQTKLIDKILINDQEIISIQKQNGMKYIVNKNTINSENSSRNKSVIINEKVVEFQISLTEKGKPTTYPGINFIEKESTIQKIIFVIESNEEYFDKEIVENSYGRYMSVYCPIRDSKNNPVGIVIIDVDDEDILKFKNQFINISIVISLISFLLTTFIALIITRFVFNPIMALTNGVQKVTSGNLFTRVVIRTKDEFEILAKSFNGMVRNIRKSNEMQEALMLEIVGLNNDLENKVIERTKQLESAKKVAENEKEKSDKLLLNILPKEVASELKENGSAKPVMYDSVTVLFTDFKGFTIIAEKLSPNELIQELDGCFVQFDKITEKYGLEKLKTIGDSYMCAGGIPKKNSTHAVDSILAAIEIQNFMSLMKDLKLKMGYPYWEVRLGIHTGPLIAGVIGEKKFAYDVWGDTVNTASRMESSGTPGKINISGFTYEIIKPYFECSYRGKINAKNKGEIDMYYVERILPELSDDEFGFLPNNEFWNRVNQNLV